MKAVVARSYFDAIGHSADAGVDCSEDESPTVQASKDECDINVIVNKYLRTGEMPGVRQGVYADISEMVDLRDAIHMVNDAQQSFMELPANVREFFRNDPTALVEFAADPRNRDKAIELGLIDVAEEPSPGKLPPQQKGGQPANAGGKRAAKQPAEPVPPEDT